MKHVILFLILNSVFSWSQDNSTMKIPVELGYTTIEIIEHWGNAREQIIFLNVHEDETTSVQTLEAYSKKDSIDYFYLHHKGTRRVSFKIKDKKYSVDPNRIFTKKGRKKSLKDGENYSRKANRIVKALALQIIGRLPKGYTVVSLHNNTDVEYSINSYAPGGDEAQNTKALYINEMMDPDDFVYTTDSYYFEALKGQEINVILQDNQAYVNDGSLSVYCGKKNIPYLNIETQKGHFKEQMELMEIVVQLIRSRQATKS